MRKSCYMAALVLALGAVIPPISPQQTSDAFTPEKTVGFSASSIYPAFVNANLAQSQKSTQCHRQGTDRDGKSRPARVPARLEWIQAVRMGTR